MSDERRVDGTTTPARLRTVTATRADSPAMIEEALPGRFQTEEAEKRGRDDETGGQRVCCRTGAVGVEGDSRRTSGRERRAHPQRGVASIASLAGNVLPRWTHPA